MKKIFLGTIALTALIFSCKKSEDATPVTPVPPTAQSQIIGKWTYVKNVDWYTSGSTTTKDTTAAKAGEYVDFRTDGKYYSHIWDGAVFKNDTVAYTVNSNKLIFNMYVSPGVYASDTLDIQTISANNLTTYLKTITPTYKDESWDFFTK